jgi:GNAT superfamily N-acetyltransferase
LGLGGDMRIVVRKYLNAPFKKQLLGLTFWQTRDSGILQRISESDKEQLSVVFCIEDRLILGWALVDSHKKDVMIYVRKSYRRKGVGRKIMARVFKRFGDVDVHPHDYYSREFFNSL